MDPVKDLGSTGLRNATWRERVEGWKMKQENRFSPVRSQSASERGVYDFDATTNVSVDEALL